MDSKLNLALGHTFIGYYSRAPADYLSFKIVSAISYF